MIQAEITIKTEAGEIKLTLEEARKLRDELNEMLGGLRNSGGWMPIPSPPIKAPDVPWRPKNPWVNPYPYRAPDVWCGSHERLTFAGGAATIVVHAGKEG